MNLPAIWPLDLRLIWEKKTMKDKNNESDRCKNIISELCSYKTLRKWANKAKFWDSWGLDVRLTSYTLHSHYLASSRAWRHSSGGYRIRSKCQLVIGQDTCLFLRKPIETWAFSESYWLKKRQSIARNLREGWGRFFPLSKLTHHAIKTDKNGMMFTYYE